MKRLTTQLRVLGIILLVAASLISAPQKATTIFQAREGVFPSDDATVRVCEAGSDDYD